MLIITFNVTEIKMSQEEAEHASQGGSEAEIEEEKGEAAYIPKNPMIRPADVEISEVMKKLMGDDGAQEHLHRILGSASDLDNENTVAEHI